MRRIECGSWSGCNGDMSQFKELVPAMPAFQTEKGVGAEQQYQRLCCAKFRAQTLQGGDAIAGCIAEYFSVIQMKAGIARDGCVHHVQTVLCGADWGGAMRGLPGRNPAYRRQIEIITGFLCQTQVAEMNRIEGAPQNAKGFQRLRHEGNL